MIIIIIIYVVFPTKKTSKFLENPQRSVGLPGSKNHLTSAHRGEYNGGSPQRHLASCLREIESYHFQGTHAGTWGDVWILNWDKIFVYGILSGRLYLDHRSI